MRARSDAGAHHEHHHDVVKPYMGGAEGRERRESRLTLIVIPAKAGTQPRLLPPPLPYPNLRTTRGRGLKRAASSGNWRALQANNRGLTTARGFGECESVIHLALDIDRLW
jgi:hypothetical protein